MLEFLANVDPMSLPLWAVLLFAAGMYPVGMFLPCSSCCGCASCITGKLPDTLTVTFDGLPEQVPGPDLCTLTFSSCYGYGAAGKVTSPGGDPVADKGPITAVALTNGGSGYAKLGRVEPTVTASGGSGTGATLTVTLAEDADECGIPFWKVDSVSVADGTGYADGDPVTFAIAEGDAEASAASATIHTTRKEPTLSASAPLGSGAAFTLSYTKNAGPPETWTISSVSVTSGGTGYHGGDSLTISLDTDDVEQDAAYAQIVTSRSEPTLSAGVSSETGSGATLSVSLSTTYDPGGDAWAVSSLGIEDGGSGYAIDDAVSISVDDGEQAPYEAAYAYVSSVDENGAITGIEIGYGGVYYKDDGIITSVTLYYGGAYYKDDGIPVSVSVDGGGVYYREDSTEPPYVAEVTVGVYQQGPTAGTAAGAVITATVGSDPNNPATFGKITALTIEDGGNNYLAYEWLQVCSGFYNGLTVVLTRNNPNFIDAPNKKCLFSHLMCGNGSLFSLINGSLWVVVEYRGPELPPKVYLPWLLSTSSDSVPEQFVFIGTENVTDCGDWGTLVAEHAATGATATIEIGGDYDATYKNPGFACHLCCRGDEVIPQEIEVTVADARPGTIVDASGIYVLQGSAPLSAIVWGTLDIPSLISLSVTITSCQPRFDAVNDCGECNSLCYLSVLGLVYFIDENSVLQAQSVTSSGYPFNDCSECEAVPLCSPVGRTFSLVTDNVNPAFVTVSI